MLQLSRLREVREEQAYSMRALSDLSGVSVNAIWRAEQGELTRPSTARKLARALGVAPADLRGDVPSTPTEPSTPAVPDVRSIRVAVNGPPGLAPLLRKAEECRLAGDLAGAARWQQHADELVEAAERGSVE